MKTKFADMLERAKSRDAFWVERAILDVTEEIVSLMKLQNVSRSELAKRLGKKPSFVTKLLRGSNNFTLETLVKIGRRLDCEYRSHFQPDGTRAQWIEFLNEEPAIYALSPTQTSAICARELYVTIAEFDNEALAAVA